MESDDSDDVVVYLEHDAVASFDNKSLRRKLSSFTESVDSHCNSKFSAPKFRRTSTPGAMSGKGTIDLNFRTELSPENKSQANKHDDFNFTTYTPQFSALRHVTSKTPSSRSFLPDASTDIGEARGDSALSELLGMSPSKTLISPPAIQVPTSRNGYRQPPPSHPPSQSIRRSNGATPGNAVGVDSFSDRPAHWSSSASIGAVAPKRVLSSSTRRRSEGVNSARQSITASKRPRASLPLSSTSSSQSHCGRGVGTSDSSGSGARMLAAGALKVSFQPSFLRNRKPSTPHSDTAPHNVDTDQIIEEDFDGIREETGPVGSSMTIKYLDHAESDMHSSTSGLSFATGKNIVRGEGHTRGLESPGSSPIKGRPPSKFLHSASTTSSKKYRKGSLSQQLQTMWKEEDALMVRFSTSIDQFPPLVMREVPSGDEEGVCGGLVVRWEEVNGVTGRVRDLQDPRTRAQRWVDVRVLDILPKSCANDEGSYSCLMHLKLQVYGTGALHRGKTECDESMRQSSPQPVAGEILVGIFKRQSIRMMNVSTACGTALRIYNYVYTPTLATETPGLRNEVIEDFESIGHLLCTQLCEQIQLMCD